MIPDLKQGTVEWKLWRKSRIGASDAPVIMGASPWMTPNELYEEKLGLRPERDLSAAMFRGQQMEEAARREYERITGNVVFPAVYVNATLPWQIASLDGITPDGKRIVEIKCPNKETHEMAMEGIIPDHYFAQLQHQMMVVGVKNADYFSYNGDTGFLVVVDFVPEYAEMMLEEEKQFMLCLQNMTPPPLLDRDYVDMENNPEWKELKEQYIAHSQLADEHAKEKDRLKGKLLQMCEYRNAKSENCKVTKVISRGRIDYDAIPDLENIDLDKYRKKETISYRISIS